MSGLGLFLVVAASSIGAAAGDPLSPVREDRIVWWSALFVTLCGLLMIGVTVLP